MIRRETIEEILLRTDIQTLIGSYVSLKRAGSNVKGLCPFHSEKTPSFTVYPANNSFYCFGCGAGGDQISFIMKMEHLDYQDAVRFLAKRAGITVVEDNNARYNDTPRVNKERVYKMNADAARFFHKSLFADTPDSRAALSYFTENRGLSLATIKHFGLGYAPNSYDAFSKHMLSLGYTYDELVTCYLCGKSERGTYYDAFRNRVMFPIIDITGNVIAFGGRIMEKSDKLAKYKNSSDTPVFKKSRNLFALNFARHTCTEALILCEGYMDVIALHSAGYTNAVATLGTALTSEQARLMCQYTKKVILCYDSDEAGQRATQRAMKILEEVGLEATVITIPDAKDPDEYIKKHGADKFKNVINAANGKFEYNLNRILSKYDLSIPQDKISALAELVKFISTIYSAAERDVYIRAVSEKFGVEFKSVKADVDKLIAKNIAQYKKNEARKIEQESAGYSDRVNPDYIKAPAVARNEENVLGLLLLFPEHREKVFKESLLSEEDFFTDLGKRIFAFLRAAYENGDVRLVELSDTFSDEEMGRISKMKISRMGLLANGTDVLIESVNGLKNAMEKKQSENVDSMEKLNAILKKKRNT